MGLSTPVEHKGRVSRIDQDSIKVGFVSHPACSGCYARGACSLSEVENKFVEAANKGEDFSVGEEVSIIMEQKQGFKALFLGYVLPLLIVLLGLIIFSIFIESEGIAGLLSISILIPYYILIYMLRDRLKKEFNFKIKKIN